MPFLALLFAFLGCALAAQTPALAQAPYKEGVHYVVLSAPAKTADPSKIEVAEVFSYDCPHCFHFEPALQAWQKRQPRDVALVRVHARWRDSMEPLIRGCYTLQTLKLADKAHMAVFNRIHVEHKTFTGAGDWADFLAGYGVDRATVLKTYDSFGVSSLVKQAQARVIDYRSSGMPEMIVNGKYRVGEQAVSSQEEMLKVVDFLVARERSRKAR